MERKVKAMPKIHEFAPNNHEIQNAKPITSLWLLLVVVLVVMLSSSATSSAAHHSPVTPFLLEEAENFPSNISPYRTAYHFQPRKNWMNDPNGPFTYKGLYHLFYQYNPKGATFGTIVWAHSISSDLVNWVPLDVAIVPSEPYDVKGCWSGSTTLVHGKPIILYTGADQLRNQAQNLAYPKNLSDPYLREWVKSSQNPLMAPTSSNKINASSFRDPTTAWLGKDKHWRVLIGSQRNTRGLAILYRSKDFVHWIKAKHPMHSALGTGMWECPDFYPVSNNSKVGVDTSADDNHVRHVLKVSLDDEKHDYYMIGTYKTADDRFIPDKNFEDSKSFLRYDYGKYYASKTFFDETKKRRILLSWANESSESNDDVKKGWSGIHTIPRVVLLDKAGKQLVQWPIAEIEKLRTNRVKWPTKVLKGGELLQIHGVTAAQADVEVSFEVEKYGEAEVLDYLIDPQTLCSRDTTSARVGLGPFGLLVLASKGLQEYTSVFFKLFRHQRKNLVLFCSNQIRSSLNKHTDKTTYGTFVDVDPLHKKLSLRSLIDHSVIESFGAKGRACITARVYPTTLAINNKAQLYAFNNGTIQVTITRLSAWSMKKAQIN